MSLKAIRRLPDQGDGAGPGPGGDWKSRRLGPVIAPGPGAIGRAGQAGPNSWGGCTSRLPGVVHDGGDEGWRLVGHLVVGPLRQGVDGGHLLLGQREVEDVEVVRHVLWAEHLRKGDIALLEVPAQHDLGGGLAVPGGGPGWGEETASFLKTRPGDRIRIGGSFCSMYLICTEEV